MSKATSATVFSFFPVLGGFKSTICGSSFTLAELEDDFLPVCFISLVFFCGRVIADFFGLQVQLPRCPHRKISMNIVSTSVLSVLSLADLLLTIRLHYTLTILITVISHILTLILPYRSLWDRLKVQRVVKETWVLCRSNNYQYIFFLKQLY